MPLGQVAGEYKARAGALTLGYLNSTIGWDELRAILAQAATGVDLVDIDAIVMPDRDEAVLNIFADRYLLEPANPDDDPDDVETKMRPTPAGREVPLLGATLHRWYEHCPNGPVVPGENSGQVLWPLLCGWTSTVVHAVSAKPRSAVEVQEEIGVIPLELVVASLGLLGRVGLIRPLPPPAAGEEMRFEPTEWLRLAVAPLAASARLELRHPRGDTAPIAAADVEALLQLTLPLLRMPARLSGSCSLSVQLDEGVVGSPAGLTAVIDEGRVVACEPGIDPQADAWVEVTTGQWLDAMIERDTRGIRSGGRHRIATTLLGALHERLFGESTP